ncbi:MAG: hypothetical protein JWQ94_3183 [Tardiphaga sp.]|nr:hypothetical protein [Tardiphaga sp.]
MSKRIALLSFAAFSTLMVSATFFEAALPR